jgi:hypothetical protein
MDGKQTPAIPLIRLFDQSHKQSSSIHNNQSAHPLCLLAKTQDDVGVFRRKVDIARGVHSYACWSRGQIAETFGIRDDPCFSE